METSRPLYDAVAGIAISITCSSKLSAWLLPRPNSSFFRKWRKMGTYSLSCVEPAFLRHLLLGYLSCLYRPVSYPTCLLPISATGARLNQRESAKHTGKHRENLEGEECGALQFGAGCLFKGVSV